MMTPLRVRAVTSSAVGNDSGRMVSEWYRVAVNGSKPLQHTDIGVEYAAGLTVQQLGRAVDGGAACDTDGLVPQADPEQRGALRGARAHQADRRPRAFRGARSGAEQDTVELRGDGGVAVW